MLQVTERVESTTIYSEDGKRIEITYTTKLPEGITSALEKLYKFTAANYKSPKRNDMLYALTKIPDTLISEEESLQIFTLLKQIKSYTVS
jgi:hypothetical protein